jgi:hypothetical protein
MLIVLVVVLAASGICSWSESQEALDSALERIYKEYSSFGGKPDVGRLVLLDQELRRLLPSWIWEGPSAPSKNYRPEYKTIGVTPTMRPCIGSLAEAFVSRIVPNLVGLQLR